MGEYFQRENAENLLDSFLRVKATHFVQKQGEKSDLRFNEQ